MAIIVNIIIMTITAISLLLNWVLIFRFHNHEAEFYLDKSDPSNVKPVLKFDLDEVEDKSFFIVKVIKDNEGK